MRRKPDERDRLSVLILRTVNGSVFLRDFGKLIVRTASDDGGASAGALLPHYYARGRMRVAVGRRAEAVQIGWQNDLRRRRLQP